VSPRSTSGPPRRRVSNTALRKELLVFVEGGTEEMYLVDWHRRHRDRVNVKIDRFRGGPLQLVEHAVEAQRAETREARRGQGDRPHDQIWCVFDRDEHPNIPEAFVLADAHGIRIAFSNPCLEVWFLLHFQDQTAEIHRHDAQHQSEVLLHCAKNLTPAATEALTERYEQAKQRATRLDEKHHGDGSPAGTNPSSGLWKTVDEIRDA